MDGHFVPNLTIGPALVKSIRAVSKLFFDVHLMIERPDNYWKGFKAAGADLIVFHVEANVDAGKLIEEIKGSGIKAGVTLCPKTDLSTLLPLIPLADVVLVMTVEPGFGGQGFIKEMLPRIRAVRENIDRTNGACLLQVDGGITPETAVESVRAGPTCSLRGTPCSVHATRRRRSRPYGKALTV